MTSAFHRSILALATIGLLAGTSIAGAQQQSDQGKGLKKYESGTKEFWIKRAPQFEAAAVSLC